MSVIARVREILRRAPLREQDFLNTKLCARANEGLSWENVVPVVILLRVLAKSVVMAGTSYQIFEV